ncbi:MAG: Kelch repeat-containing protein [Thermoplasmata archaeon]
MLWLLITMAQSTFLAECEDVEKRTVEPIYTNLTFPFCGACGALVGDRYYIFGGMYDGYYSNAIFAYNFTTQTLSMLNLTLPVGFAYGGAVAYNGSIYILTGIGNNSTYPNKFFKFDYESTKITELQYPSGLPLNYAYFGMLTWIDRIYVIGGKTGNTPVRDVHWFSPFHFRAVHEATMPTDAINSSYAVIEHGLAGYNITAEGNNYAEISDFGYCGDALHFYDRDVNGYCWIEMPNQHHRFFGTYSLRFALYLPDTNEHWPWVLVDGGVGFALDYNALFLVVSHTGATEQ